MPTPPAAAAAAAPALLPAALGPQPLPAALSADPCCHRLHCCYRCWPCCHYCLRCCHAAPWQQCQSNRSGAQLHRCTGRRQNRQVPAGTAPALDPQQMHGWCRDRRSHTKANPAQVCWQARRGRATAARRAVPAPAASWQLPHSGPTSAQQGGAEGQPHSQPITPKCCCQTANSMQRSCTVHQQLLYS